MGQVAQACLSFSDWSDYMDKFSIKVEKGIYSKIEYQLWKRLVKKNKEKVVNVQLTTFPSIRVNDGAFLVDVFSPWDHSLGSYLFETLFTEEERHMAISFDSSTVASATAANSMYSTTAIGGITANTSIIDTGVYISAKADKCEVDHLASQVSALEAEKKAKEKEEKKMSMFNFDFGPCTNNDVRLSMYGLAVRNTAGEWVSYNPESKEIINVEIATLKDGGKYMYKMPVAVNDIKVGDIVIHNKVPMFITTINEDGTFGVTDVRAGETKTIIPTRNMFGFNFMTKIVSLFDTMSTAPTADQPFGNMLPFLMASEGEMDPMAMAMFMSMQGGKNNPFAQNPMMLYFFANSKDNKMDPMAMMLMMSSMNK